MTRDNSGPHLCIAGRPAAARLRAVAPALTRRIVARLRAELPAYAELPGEALTGDIADIVQHNLRMLADSLELRRPPGDTELARQRDSAGQRAEEGVPLDAILTAYHLGTTMCWQELSAGARPGELPDVTQTVTHILTLQQYVTSAVSAGYLEARRALDSEEHRGRHALMTALLAGDPAEGGSERYVALTLALAPHPDETGEGPGARIAARRKLRRIRSALDAHGGEPPLTALGPDGGTVLLPAAAPPPWTELTALVARTADAAGVPVTAAAETAEPPGIPAAVARTAEVVALVRRSGRPPGLYRLADVLLDYQLSRPGEALYGLASLLRPLEGKPELLRTLETHLARELDRRATAAALHIHPNTVDYRLRRITTLTGLSPSRPLDLQHLGAALVARRSLCPDG
ncbi:PucR family transcriptional regulator [Streptomyces prasinopilosus]|uniref:PucR C-terminal helix-turn-helix domain-containing protein n=1 Tax=Streptomyces prasinopilosus TaxID=67344 RepID=A0A1G6XWT8_9ACTN|nr:helix-turn-helix domain-containing protein [Streptomyces prasinopilosus]SDD82704.1 PucR C-terminal helix-turn-helix domain-containing protein [Streptomyces prasinopilosus]